MTAPADPDAKCGACYRCLDDPSKGMSNPVMRRMVLCPQCGNKRCPHADSHVFECTDSNEVGQVGVVRAPDPDAREARRAAEEWLMAHVENADVADELPAHGRGVAMRATKKPKAVEVPPCDLCGATQDVLGAILYGPPEPKHGRTMSEKSHVCISCYADISARAYKH